MVCFLDADECSLGLDNCHHNANCTDIVDGFMCTCNTGYTGNGTHCESKLFHSVSCTKMMMLSTYPLLHSYVYTNIIQILMSVLIIMEVVNITVLTLKAVTTVHVSMDMIWSTLLIV